MEKTVEMIKSGIGGWIHKWHQVIAISIMSIPNPIDLVLYFRFCEFML